MDFRHAPTLGLLLALLSAAPAMAQQAPGSTTVDPYSLHRPPAYTSSDNPYAPGAIYDPYRVTNLATLSGKTGKSTTDSKATMDGKATTGGAPHSKSGKHSVLDDTDSGSGTAGTAANSASSGNSMSGSGSSRCQGGNAAGMGSTTSAARRSGSAGMQNSTKKKSGCGSGSSGTSAEVGLNRPRPPQSPGINQRQSQQKGQ
jgi:hypothetical protein